MIDFLKKLGITILAVITLLTIFITAKLLWRQHLIDQARAGDSPIVLSGQTDWLTGTDDLYLFSNGRFELIYQYIFGNAYVLGEYKTIEDTIVLIPEYSDHDNTPEALVLNHYKNKKGSYLTRACLSNNGYWITDTVNTIYMPVYKNSLINTQ